jgi:predicted Zn-dependent peptidase
VVNERLYRGSNEAALDLLKSLFEHPRLGTATSLPDTATAMTFCLATLRRHHRKWYRFGNANLIMASPRTWTELKPIINAAFRTDEAASNGTPPLRVIATPKEQNRPMRISFGPNQKTVKLKMATGFPNPLPPAVTLLFRTLVRIRLMDGLRASFRTSYSPQVYFEHHGVATIFRVTATAARDMAPTLRDGLTGPFEDPGWVSDYLEPVRKTLHAGLTLEPEGSIQSRLSSFTKLLHMHGKPIRRQETIDHLEKISEEEIVALLTYVNRIGFHKTLS